MTARDRTVLMVLGLIALMAGFYFVGLKPTRDEAKALDAKVTAAQERLDAANTAVASGAKAKTTYRSDYAAVARLGKAVPTDDDTASLVFQIERAADRAMVDFRSIELTGTAAAAAPAPAATPATQAAALSAEQKGKKDAAATPAAPATGAPATQSAAAGLPPGAAVGPAGFPTMPFDFKFNGRFFRLETFLEELDRMTKIGKDGQISATGRLLTVDGFSLSEGPSGFPAMTASIHATGYLLPVDQGLTDGATPSSPSAVTDPATPAGGSGPAPVAVAAGVGR